MEEEKKAKIEEDNRKKAAQEERKRREQEEFERDLELLRLKMAEEEKERIEMERLAYLEQEENDRKALIDKQEKENITHREEPPPNEPALVVVDEEEKQESPVIEKEFTNQIPAMNFEILVNQAIQNEFKNPNIPLQLEALKLEEHKNDVEEETSLKIKNSPKFELPLIQLELFEEWHKHNVTNFFENIKLEFESKIKQQSTNKTNIQQRPRPRSSKIRNQNIPENLLLKKSNKNSLNEINFLYFHALTSYSLNSLELCTNLAVLVLTNSQITILDGLNNCTNLKYINVQVSFFFVVVVFVDIC